MGKTRHIRTHRKSLAKDLAFFLLQSQWLTPLIHHKGSTLEFDPNGPLASCVPEPGDANNHKYLMFPSVANAQTDRYFNQWSTCSRDRIANHLDDAGSCLIKPDPCFEGGACCDGNGNLKSEGTSCRGEDSTKPCKAEAVCDGLHPECPANDNKADGTYCAAQEDGSGNHGTCAAGVCGHIHAGYCSTMLADLGIGPNQDNGPCTIPGYECVRFCNSAWDASKCYLGSSWQGRSISISTFREGGIN